MKGFCIFLHVSASALPSNILFHPSIQLHFLPLIDFASHFEVQCSGQLELLQLSPKDSIVLYLQKQGASLVSSPLVKAISSPRSSFLIIHTNPPAPPLSYSPSLCNSLLQFFFPMKIQIIFKLLHPWWVPFLCHMIHLEVFSYWCFRNV